MEPNLTLCLLIAALGGTCSTSSQALVLYGSRRQSPNGSGVFIVGNLLLQALAAACYTMAPWFGPVSLVQPTIVSAKLLSNVLIVGGCLHIRQHPSHGSTNKHLWDKSTQVATLNCVLAVILLPLLGPQAQEDQDVATLLLAPYTLIFCVGVGALFLMATVLMLAVDLTVRPQWEVQACLLSVSVIASAFGGTIAKAFLGLSQPEERPAQISLIVFYVVLQLVWTVENIIEATAVPSLVVFVPLYLWGSLALNAILGILVWEDWKVVDSWLGYSCVFALMLLAVFLLSDLEFYRNEQTQLRAITNETAESVRAAIYSGRSSRSQSRAYENNDSARQMRSTSFVGEADPHKEEDEKVKHYSHKVSNV